MFGRKETQGRSLEDILTPRNDSAELFDDEVISDELETDKEGTFDVVSGKKSSAIKPLDCFGMEEAKTEAWLIKCVKFWYCVMSFMWFLFGAATFAPVIYIGNKMNVIFKSKTRSLVCSILLYSMLVLAIVLFSLLG